MIQQNELDFNNSINQEFIYKYITNIKKRNEQLQKLLIKVNKKTQSRTNILKAVDIIEAIQINKDELEMIYGHMKKKLMITLKTKDKYMQDFMKKHFYITYDKSDAVKYNRIWKAYIESIGFIPYQKLKDDLSKLFLIKTYRGSLCVIGIKFH